MANEVLRPCVSIFQVSEEGKGIEPKQLPKQPTQLVDY